MVLSVPVCIFFRSRLTFSEFRWVSSWITSHFALVTPSTLRCIIIRPVSYRQSLGLVSGSQPKHHKWQKGCKILVPITAISCTDNSANLFQGPPQSASHLASGNAASQAGTVCIRKNLEQQLAKTTQETRHISTKVVYHFDTNRQHKRTKTAGDIDMSRQTWSTIYQPTNRLQEEVSCNCFSACKRRSWVYSQKQKPQELQRRVYKKINGDLKEL